jgi:hypothetical protein
VSDAKKNAVTEYCRILGEQMHIELHSVRLSDVCREKRMTSKRRLPFTLTHKVRYRVVTDLLISTTDGLVTGIC